LRIFIAFYVFTEEDMIRAQIRFVDPSKDRSAFFSTLRARVDGYFKDNKLSKHYNAEMVVKTVVLLLAYLLPFCVLLLTDLRPWAQMSLWSIMGLGLAGIGMSIMHDANHGAYSSSSRVNYWLGSTLNLLGGSMFNWKLQHNILHHTYTNIVHHDDDIDDKLILRFSPHTRVRWYHRLQIFYAFIFYGILTLYWAFAKDFIQFRRYTRTGVNKNTASQNRVTMARIIAAKIVYVFVFIVLPLFIIGKNPGMYFLGFLVMHFIAGILLTVIFQLAHTVEGTTHPLPGEDNVIENNWAIHQLQTTVNFARTNTLLSWYLGGLNFQVEHHLFPLICHVHYPAISGIVENTCAEFGVPYLENKTFTQALNSHLRTLVRFGKLPPLNEAIG
jgi:linoleoyl-CoA desaturase